MTKQPKTNITCKFCSQKFTSMIDAYRHICMGKKIKWKNPVISRSKLKVFTWRENGRRL